MNTFKKGTGGKSATDHRAVWGWRNNVVIANLNYNQLSHCDAICYLVLPLPRCALYA